MAKQNGFDKVEFFDTKRLRGVAERHKTKFLVRVTESGLDYKGKKFKGYSKSYGKLISKGFTKKDGSKLKAFRQFSIAGKTIDPKFNLRGLTMGNFAVQKVTTDSYTLGWTDEAAEIVAGNKKKDRNIVDDFPPKEWDGILTDLVKEVGIQFKKIPNLIVIKA